MKYPLLLAAIFIIIAIIIIKKLLSRRQEKQVQREVKESEEIPKMPPFKRPGEEQKRSVLEEVVVRRQISLPKERLTIRSLKDLEKAYKEGLISEGLYEKTRKKLLEEE